VIIIQSVLDTTRGRGYTILKSFSAYNRGQRSKEVDQTLAINSRTGTTEAVSLFQLCRTINFDVFLKNNIVVRCSVFTDLFTDVFTVYAQISRPKVSRFSMIRVEAKTAFK
jgi:hypothetical protein